jgi:hypothetical protein
MPNTSSVIEHMSRATLPEIQEKLWSYFASLSIAELEIAIAAVDRALEDWRSKQPATGRVVLHVVQTGPDAGVHVAP